MNEAKRAAPTAVTSSCAAVMSIIVNRLSYSAMRPVCPAAAAARPASGAAFHSCTTRTLAIGTEATVRHGGIIATAPRSASRHGAGSFLTKTRRLQAPAHDTQHSAQQPVCEALAQFAGGIRTVDSVFAHHLERAAVEHMLLPQNLYNHDTAQGALRRGPWRGVQGQRTARVVPAQHLKWAAVQDVLLAEHLPAGSAGSTHTMPTHLKSCPGQGGLLHLNIQPTRRHAYPSGVCGQSCTAMRAR